MIIKSILDTDLYKFTTSYAYMKLFPQAVGTFEFKDRDNTEYTEEFVEQLRIELYNLAQVRLTSDEFEFMNSIRFIPRHYWEWLSQFTFNPSKVQIFLDEEKHLHIVAKDYLYKVSLYEVPILAMVSAGQIMHPHDEMAESDCWSQLCAKHGEDVVNKVWSRHLASEFKRKKAPIYIPRKEYEND